MGYRGKPVRSGGRAAGDGITTGARTLRSAHRSRRGQQSAHRREPDGAQAIAADLAVRLNDWRQQTGDVIPSEFAGTRISERYTQTYLQIHHRTPTSRSPIAADRGIEEEVKHAER
ncbi:putative sulfatase [Mycobacterium xenopi 4042]|uniref:Putative sulfatase n=1 Tax=Mycobacterium xenopi 4042 TaxID=1299334 RepID=X7Z993_MYCXE|nr:putative sulfatase [Mycobacterium xenopi 4042]